MKQPGGVTQIVFDATAACFFSVRALEIEAGERRSFQQTLRR
jgi:hypothetical protein